MSFSPTTEPNYDGWELPVGMPYQVARSSDEDNLLVSWFSMARGFVSVVMNKPPFDLVTELIDKDKIETEDVLDILKSEAGFMACLAIGLLFLLMLIIGGPIVCCCRCCCDNCGGKSYQRNANNVRCRRQSYMVALFTFLVFISVGIACSFLTASAGVSRIKTSDDTFLGVINNARIFANNTLQEARYLTKTGIVHTLDLTESKLDDVQKNAGQPFVKDLRQLYNSDLKTRFQSFDKDSDNLRHDFEILKDGLKNFYDSNPKLKNDGKVVFDAIDDFKINGCEAKCDGLNAAVLNFNFPAGISQNSVDEDKTIVDSMASRELVQHFNSKIEDVPQKIESFAANGLFVVRRVLSDFKKTLTDKNEISDSADEAFRYVDKFYNDSRKLIRENLQLTEETNDIFNIAKWIISSFLLLILVPTVFWFLGLLFGILGGSEDQYLKPARRGCLSNTGGCCLMTGVYLFFFLSIITVLVTMIQFQVGGHIQAYACEPFFQDDFHSVDRFYAGIPRKFKTNITTDFVPSSILNKCKDNMTVVNAFGLKDTVQREMDKHMNFENQTDINDKLAQINFLDVNDYFKLSNVKESVSQVNLKQTTELLDELSKNFPNTKKLIEELTSLELKIADLANKEKLTQILQDVKKFDLDVSDSQWAKSLELTSTILDLLVKIKTDFNKVDVNAFTNSLNDIIQKVKEDFADDVLQPGRDYLGFVKKSITDDVARCWILWDTFDVFRHVLCRDIVDTLNGYWYGLGWCLFFEFFAVICATKLSRHFYRMDSQDTEHLTYNYENGSKDVIMGGGGGYMREAGMPMQDRSYVNGGYKEYH